MLTAAQERYVRFVEFIEPFATLLQRQVRTELVCALRERHGDLAPEDEELALTEDELGDPLLADLAKSPRRTNMVRLVNIHLPKRVYGTRMRFDLEIGNAIRIRNCQLLGRRGSYRVVTPTSEQLRVRPVMLTNDFEATVIEKAREFLEGPPPPHFDTDEYPHAEYG